MDTEKIVKRTILLNGTPTQVWDALTNPEKTKQYMFNCTVNSDWKIGSTISWKGNYRGYESAERGIILNYDKDRQLKYTSFDPNFGLDDVPENYLQVTYVLAEKNGQTELTTTIENLNNDPNRLSHVAKAWDEIVLPGMIKLFPLKTISITPFLFIGITVRTTNENGQAATDIGQLWNRFISENITEKIPNKVDSTIYSIYTDYEKDYTKPYTTLLGCQVSSLDRLPEGLIGRTFEGGQYLPFTAKGNLADGIVYNEWQKIWAADIPRSYTADFEVYGEKAQNPEDAEVTIFIGVE